MRRTGCLSLTPKSHLFTCIAGAGIHPNPVSQCQSQIKITSSVTLTGPHLVLKLVLLFIKVLFKYRRYVAPARFVLGMEESS